MFNETLFKVGPFNICIWNFVFLILIFFTAFVVRKLLSRFLKRTLRSNNIQIEGRRETYFRIFTQSVYLLAIYIAVISFRFNNPNITFNDFIKYEMIHVGALRLSLYNVILVVAIFIFARIFIGLYKLYIGRKAQAKRYRDHDIEFVYVQIARYIIYLLAFLLSINVLGLDISLILTGSVGLLVGIGLGLQDVFKDTIAGIVLLLEGNIKVGDIVEINTDKSNLGKHPTYMFVARIIKISVRTSQIQTREGNIQIIPNSHLTQNKVENWSHSSRLSMFTIHVQIEYGSDTELASKLLIAVAKEHAMVDKKESTFVRLSNFSESGIDLELVFWAKNSWDILNFKSDLRFEIDQRFRLHDIRFAYPTRTIISKNKN
jgi:small-conductance mechanosensitive channel